MRVTSLMAAAFVLACAGSGFAQDEWVEFASREDGFRISFPGRPQVQEATWTSQMGYLLPARVFSVDRGRERYTVTVIDYRGIEQQGIAKAKACPPAAETCVGGQIRLVGPGYWKSDVHGAMTYATFKLVQRDAKLTGMTWNWAEQVEGTLLQFTNNADQSRTSAAIYMHDSRLYIIEGTVPRGALEPELFKVSIVFLTPEGDPTGRIYSSVYSHYMGMGESPMPERCGLRGCAAVGSAPGSAAAAAPAVRTRRQDFPGLAHFFPIDGTAANGGQFQAHDLAILELIKRGYRSVINVADGPVSEAEAAAVRASGMRYLVMPIGAGGSAGQYDPARIDPILKAMTDPANQPVYLSSGNGHRTAMLWMIKRVLVDGWSIEQAGAEASAIGLVNDDPMVPSLWKFAQDYVSAYSKR